MKSRLTPISLFLILFFCFTAQGQIFVKANATGMDNGSSWADAYTNLTTAIDSADAGDEIWVAEGTYLPGTLTPSVSSSFNLKNGVAIYGGFNGTEIMLSQRDYNNNVTILSGDLNGDDVSGDFTVNRTDNVLHVVSVLDTLINETAVLDGFLLSGGNTAGGSGSDDDRRGGGILTYGNPTVRNCSFIDNYGYFGGGLYIRFGHASDMVVENCRFLGNHGQAGGAIYINSVLGGLIKGCEFYNNSAAGDGGAIYNQASLNELENCIFESNSPGTNNRGGALYVVDSPIDARGCTFKNNSCTRTGGAIHILSSFLMTASFQSCLFEGNSSTGWGGALTAYNANLSVVLDICTFKSNNSVRSGGSMSIGFGAQVSLNDCNFEENRSDESGGAIFLQNDNTGLIAEKTNFTGNVSGSNGGAINATAGQSVQFSNSFFESNQAVVGGAINFGESGLDIGNIKLNNCKIIANVAETQGGAMNFSNVEASLTNCNISFNFASDIGTGGAISNNASSGDSASVTILNSTLADNTGALAGGIAQWTDSDTSFAILSLQNTIIHNASGTNYAIEAGSPTVVSNGGNLCSDMTLSGILSGMNDLEGIDPQFDVSPSFDYELMATSPCINMGVASGAPLTDIYGNPRVGEVDQGAYEFQGMVGTHFESFIDGEIVVFPNPVSEILYADVKGGFSGKCALKIYNYEGRMVEFFTFVKNSDVYTLTKEVNHWSDGQYFMRVSQGKKTMVGSFSVMNK